jgi:hypothetical protein
MACVIQNGASHQWKFWSEQIFFFKPDFELDFYCNFIDDYDLHCTKTDLSFAHRTLQSLIKLQPGLAWCKSPNRTALNLQLPSRSQLARMHVIIKNEQYHLKLNVKAAHYLMEIWGVRIQPIIACKSPDCWRPKTVSEVLIWGGPINPVSPFVS